MTASSPKLTEPAADPIQERPHASHHASGAGRHANHHATGHHHHSTSFDALVSGANHRHAARAPLSTEVNGALQTAMSKEGVPTTWEAPLQFIIGEESNGRVGATNHTDSARGLFQLTRASYHLNPNGANSFGNPVEEAQGGIRYIQQRYQTADNAAEFWQKHGWY